MENIFEKIIAREIPAAIVYEDEATIAFLDINPINKGHTLVVPKQKCENIFDGDSEIFTNMMRTAHKIARALPQATGATGVNITMNNGADAGQEVPHAHIHVIPRFADDHVFTTPKHATYIDGEADDCAAQIRSALTD